jgi:hypothetical protein
LIVLRQGSVQFAFELEKPGAVCGMMNARNSYGGYSEQRPWLFIVATGETQILEESGDYTADRLLQAVPALVRDVEIRTISGR